MPPVWIPVLVYLGVLSLLAVILTVLDKKRAQNGKWRIRESTLLLVSALGGSLAMYLTMRSIHHKTRHKKFMIGIPVRLVLQGLLAAACFFWWG